MNGTMRLIAGMALLVISGCTNALYQGELTAPDAYGNERHFILYWTRTEPLLGQDKAGPAILLTECSLTRIDFSDQAEGVVFRGMPGEDRLSGATDTVALGQVCGILSDVSSLRQAGVGTLEVRIDCQPLPPDEFAVSKRNYLAASPPSHSFNIIEAKREWSFLGQTLAGPEPPACRQ